MDCEEELDIAIKQSANLTNWRLNFFSTLRSPPGVAAALKTSRTEKGESGCSRGTEKKSIGVPLRSSLSHRSIQFEKKRVKRVVRGVREWAEGKLTRVVLMVVAVVLKAKQKLGDILGRLRKHGRSRENAERNSDCQIIVDWDRWFLK